MLALFMAGGSGTRLWPLSRKNHPKQLHNLVGEKSLMTQTIERMSPIIDPGNIWIVTNRDYAERIAKDSAGVPKDQILTEPYPLGTSLAIGLGLIHIAQKEPNAIIMIGWADSYIGDDKAFRTALRQAEELSTHVDGVILGVVPTCPSTAYGYIEAGGPIPNFDNAFEIALFEEKPLVGRAEEFLGTGRHFWNPGISVWRVSRLLELMREHKPDHFAALEYVAKAIGAANEYTKMEEAFRDLDRMAIDHSIFEKATRMATIPVDLNWNDIGSWAAIYDVQEPDADENVTRGSIVSVDTNNCLIYANKRLVATLGISDLVIVETEDAILVARKDDLDGMKKLYAKVEEYGGSQYL